MNQLNVYYVWDENLIEQSDRLPAVIGRASMVHSLIASYDILDHVKVVRSSPASYKELTKFHLESYIDHLKSFSEVDDEYMSTSQDEEYGIGYDCPPVSNMFHLVSTVAGGSITAAKSVILGMADVAINWCGGWHHAQRSGAEGFCYINDIVLAIETLRQKFPKVLYIDLDVHHGNGVQNAYDSCDAVFTLSFHKYEPGFYPGTGGVEDIGTLAGQGFSCNVPLHASYSDDTFEYVFEKIFESIHARFSPDAVVLQCGADALAHDPHGGARLTIDGYCNCVRRVLDKRKPLILLGGGGYKHQNAARLWSSITALVAGTTIDVNIPEHTYWPSYGPGYMLSIEPTLARDTNKKYYLDACISTITDNINKYLGKGEEIESDEEIALKRRKTESTKTEVVQSSLKIEECEINLEKNVISKYKSFKDKSQNNNNELQKQCTVDVYDFIDD